MSDRTLAITRTPREPSANFTIATEVWVVEYREVQRKTLIRTSTGRDIPARGRFWIEPATGRVLMSELTADSSAVRATIDVSYQSEPLLGYLVPIEMRERYEAGATASPDRRETPPTASSASSRCGSEERIGSADR